MRAACIKRESCLRPESLSFSMRAVNSTRNKFKRMSKQPRSFLKLFAENWRILCFHGTKNNRWYITGKLLVLKSEVVEDESVYDYRRTLYISKLHIQIFNPSRIWRRVDWYMVTEIRMSWLSAYSCLKAWMSIKIPVWSSDLAVWIEYWALYASEVGLHVTSQIRYFLLEVRDGIAWSV